MNQYFSIKGMHCEACTKLIAKRIRSLTRVLDARVSLSTSEATVFTERAIDAGEINEALKGTDYQAEEKI